MIVPPVASECSARSPRAEREPLSARAHDRRVQMRRATIARLQKSLIDPLDKLAFALRVPPPGDALLETTGRRTGRLRVTPVCDCLEGDTFWIVAQDGCSADYVRNIEANPHVRVKGSLSRGGWRSGTAQILQDDDPAERVRILSRGNRWRRLCLRASSAMGTSPLIVRIDLESDDGDRR